MEVKSVTPGPGTYDDGLNISRERNKNNDYQYYNSDYKNVLTSNFGKYSERFDKMSVKKFIVDDYNSATPNVTSSIRKKQMMESRRTPGPGHYELVSEFGKYDAKRLSSNRNEFQLNSTTMSNH